VPSSNSFIAITSSGTLDTTTLLRHSELNSGSSCSRSKIDDASVSIATVKTVLSSSLSSKLEVWLAKSGKSLEDRDDSVLREGSRHKCVESERAIPPRIVQSDEGNPPLMSEGEVWLTLETGIVGAKDTSSGPVGAVADNPVGAWSLSPQTVALLRLQQGLRLQGVQIVCPTENPDPYQNLGRRGHANRWGQHPRGRLWWR